jgi:hypothetical protein
MKVEAEAARPVDIDTLDAADVADAVDAGTSRVVIARAETAGAAVRAAARTVRMKADAGFDGLDVGIDVEQVERY